MTNNLKTATNEQMREKAVQLVERCYDDLPCSQRPEPFMPYKRKLMFELNFALQEAHAAGRQEILDRLPSDEQVQLELGTGYVMGINPDADEYFESGYKSAIRWLKSRLLGESK